MRNKSACVCKQRRNIVHRAATNLPLLITVKKGGSTRDGGTLIVVLLWCCFSELDRYLKPDKKRAEELRKEFQAGFDGIASRIWPNLRIIRGRTTGMVAKCHVFVFIRLKKKKKWTPGCYESLLARHKQRTHPKALSLLSFHLLHFQILVANLTFKKWCDFKEICVCQCFFPPRYLGRQELYAKRLREKYTGDVPMYSSLYISSESIIGVNLWPKDEPMYLPVLSAAFFEFVPVENCHEEQAKVSFRWTLCPDWLVARFFLHPLLRTSRASHVMIVQAYVKKKQKLLFISHSFQRRSLYILFQSHHEKDNIAVEAFFLLFLTLYDHSQSWK